MTGCSKKDNECAGHLVSLFLMIGIFRMAGECNGHLVFLLFDDRHYAKEGKEYAGYFTFLFLLTCCRSCRQCVFNFKKKYELG